MGQAELKSFGFAKRHVLLVSTQQMIVLMLFNERAAFSMQEMSDASGLPLEQVKRCVQALSAARHRILAPRRDGAATGAKLTPHTPFVVNAALKSNKMRIKVGVIASERRENVAQSKATRTVIAEDRKHVIDASIVRIMKSRRRFDHNSLISEVTKQIKARFLPDPMFIKV